MYRNVTSLGDQERGEGHGIACRRIPGMVCPTRLSWVLPLVSSVRRWGIPKCVCVVFRVSGLGDDNEVLWRKLVVVVSPCGEREVDGGVLLWFVAPQILLISVEGGAQCCGVSPV